MTLYSFLTFLASSMFSHIRVKTELKPRYNLEKLVMAIDYTEVVAFRDQQLVVVVISFNLKVIPQVA